MNAFNLRLVSSTDEVTLAATGELDLASNAALISKLDEAAYLSPARILLDLRNVTFIDTRAMETLVDAERRATDLGYELRMSAVRPQVQRALSLVGADRYLKPAA